MSHHHHHGLHHGHETHRGRLAAALTITVAILAAELAGAWVTGSLALLVDAGHMLTDAGGLALALAAATLSLRPASARRTWGWRRAEVLAAALQALILLGVGAFAVVEGVRRLAVPTDVDAGGTLLFGVLGLAGNIAALLVLAGGRDANLNLRAAFLEVGMDALGSIAVIVGAVVMATTGWAQADAVAGLLIAVFIVPRALAILRESGTILLESAPRGLDIEEVRHHLLGVPHVLDVHDLHASQIATGLPVISAHVVLEDACFYDGHAQDILHSLQRCVAGHFPVSVEHSTFQLESATHARGEHGLH